MVTRVHNPAESGHAHLRLDSAEQIETALAALAAYSHRRRPASRVGRDTASELALESLAGRLSTASVATALSGIEQSAVALSDTEVDLCIRALTWGLRARADLKVSSSRKQRSERLLRDLEEARGREALVHK